MTIVMSVNTNGHTVYAHESLSLHEIVDIIQHDEDLISKKTKFGFVTRANIADTEFLLAHLQYSKILVRTRGRDASKEYTRVHTPVVCECGCKVHRGLLWKHRKTKKHARLMAEKGRVKGEDKA